MKLLFRQRVEVEGAAVVQVVAIPHVFEGRHHLVIDIPIGDVQHLSSIFTFTFMSTFQKLGH